VFLRGAGVPEPFIVQMKALVAAMDLIQFYSCFISYSHADKPFARALHDTLQGRGIRCWLDEKQVLPGDDLYEQIDRGIRKWDKLLLCCSEHSLKPASWVDKEIITALEKEDDLTRERSAKVRAPASSRRSRDYRSGGSIHFRFPKPFWAPFRYFLAQSRHWTNSSGSSEWPAV
jgi:hypothetical protein